MVMSLDSQREIQACFQLAVHLHNTHIRWHVHGGSFSRQPGMVPEWRRHDTSAGMGNNMSISYQKVLPAATDYLIPLSRNIYNTKTSSLSSGGNLQSCHGDQCPVSATCLFCDCRKVASSFDIYFFFSLSLASWVVQGCTHIVL